MLLFTTAAEEEEAVFVAVSAALLLPCLLLLLFWPDLPLLFPWLFPPLPPMLLLVLVAAAGVDEGPSLNYLSKKLFMASSLSFGFFRLLFLFFRFLLVAAC